MFLNLCQIMTNQEKIAISVDNKYNASIECDIDSEDILEI